MSSDQSKEKSRVKSLSPDSKKVEANIQASMLNLVKSSFPAKYQNPTDYKLGLDDEVRGFNNMKEILEKDFNFDMLCDLLKQILRSQENHNKHLAYLLNKQLNQNNQVFNRHNELVQKTSQMSESLTNIKFQMVYVKDELIKFEAERLHTSEMLAKTVEDLEVLSKATTSQFNQVESNVIQEGKVFKSAVEKKFGVLEKELALLAAETQIHQNKQQSMVSSHNSLNEKVQEFLEENRRYQKVQDMQDIANAKYLAKVEKIHHSMKQMSDAIQEMDMQLVDNNIFQNRTNRVTRQLTEQFHKKVDNVEDRLQNESIVPLGYLLQSLQKAEGLEEVVVDFMEQVHNQDIREESEEDTEEEDKDFDITLDEVANKMNKQNLTEFFKENAEVAKLLRIDTTKELPVVSRIIGQLMNYDDGETFFKWAKLHKSKTTHGADAVRVPYPSLMDYGSVQEGAYNTRMDETHIQDDLQDVEPRAYQKSELPAKEKSLRKNKTMREKARNIQVEVDTQEQKDKEVQGVDGNDQQALAMQNKQFADDKMKSKAELTIGEKQRSTLSGQLQGALPDAQKPAEANAKQSAGNPSANQTPTDYIQGNGGGYHLDISKHANNLKKKSPSPERKSSRRYEKPGFIRNRISIRNGVMDNTKNLQSHDVKGKIKKAKMSLHDIVFQDPHLSGNERLAGDLAMIESQISTPNEASESGATIQNETKQPGITKHKKDSIKDQQKLKEVLIMKQIKTKSNELTRNEEQLLQINEELVIINRNLNLVIGQAINIPNMIRDLDRINEQLSLHGQVLKNTQKLQAITEQQQFAISHPELANEVKENVLAMEKAKIMGEINLNVRSMVHVNIQPEQKHENFDQYVHNIQNFLQTSQDNLISKFSSQSKQNQGQMRGSQSINEQQRESDGQQYVQYDHFRDKLTKPILSDQERESRQRRLMQERLQRQANKFGKYRQFAQGPVNKIVPSPYKDQEHIEKAIQKGLHDMNVQAANAPIPGAISNMAMMNQNLTKQASSIGENTSKIENSVSQRNKSQVVSELNHNSMHAEDNEQISKQAQSHIQDIIEKELQTSSKESGRSYDVSQGIEHNSNNRSIRSKTQDNNRHNGKVQEQAGKSPASHVLSKKGQKTRRSERNASSSKRQGENLAASNQSYSSSKKVDESKEEADTYDNDNSVELNFNSVHGKDAQQAAYGFTEKHEKILMQTKNELRHLKHELEEVREKMNKKLKKMSKQGTLNMNLGSVSYKDFQVTIESLRKQIQNTGLKSQILTEVDKRIKEKVEVLASQISEKMEKKHGNKIDQIKKTNMFIVEELLNLDNQQRINYKNFMKKLKQIDEQKGNRVLSSDPNGLQPGDALVTKGEIPDINCLSCNQNISPHKVDKMVENDQARKTFGASSSIGIGLGSGSNTARLFPKRSTNIKMAHIGNIMEESIYTKREKSNKIFENNENLQNLIGAKGSGNHRLGSTMGEIRGTVNTASKRSTSEVQNMSQTFNKKARDSQKDFFSFNKGGSGSQKQNRKVIFRNQSSTGYNNVDIKTPEMNSQQSSYVAQPTNAGMEDSIMSNSKAARNLSKSQTQAQLESAKDTENQIFPKIKMNDKVPSNSFSKKMSMTEQNQDMAGTFGAHNIPRLKTNNLIKK